MSASDYTDTAGPPSATTGTDTPGVSDRVKQTAGTAASEAHHVASVAQDEAKNVASEAKSQARNLVGQATTQVEDQSRERAQRLAGTVRTFGDDLHTMAENSQDGLAADLARQVADRARSLSAQLESQEPRELLENLKDFARRRPGTFLLGALTTGMVAGRLARGAKEAQAERASSVVGSGSTEDPLHDTGVTTAGTQPSSGAVPTGPEARPVTGTAAPLAAADRLDPQTSADRAVPTGLSAPGGQA